MEKQPEKEEKKPKDRYIEFKDLINTFYEDEDNYIEETTISHSRILDKNINLIPKLIYDKYTKELKLELKIGNSNQLYKIKDIISFYEKMKNKEIYKYGTKLEFLHTEESFNKDSIELLKFVMKNAEIMKYLTNTSNNLYKNYGPMQNNSGIILSNTSLDELFSILKGKNVLFEKDYITNEVLFTEEKPDIKFEIGKENEEEYKIVCNIDTYNTYEVFYGKENIYLLYNNSLYQCENSYKESTLKILDVFKRNYTSKIKFAKEQLPNFFSIILPKVEDDIILAKDDEEELMQCMPQKLEVRMFLECNDKNYIIATVLFRYNNLEFNPIKESIDIPRNSVNEAKVLNMLRKSGFMLDKKNARFVLTQDNDIYEFLTNGVNEYINKYEVLTTNDFLKKQVKQAHINNVGVKVENNLLKIDLSGFNFNKNELKEILKKYNLKKRFHKLKDGSFLSIENSQDLEFINDLIEGTEFEYKDFENEQIILPMHRSLYINRILEKLDSKNISKNKEYKQIVSKVEEKNSIEEITIPNEVNNILRNYQKVGYRWLKTLDEYNFSGILADDMGLGKTLQIISIMLEYIENTKQNKEPIIVVCPSSLSLNWKSEIEKFAPNIKTLVISGGTSTRKQQINSIGEYDVVITSYDLLKRDIEFYNEKNYIFRYIIADEAQYIKNSNTKNAKAIKQINGRTKYALTGTPIENSLSELWSIFDFLMPGYLFSYNKFKEKYEIPILSKENNEAMEKLKMEIEPFILRRTKKQVLTELPDKTITVLNNEMEETQQKVYLSYLAQARSELQQELEINGLENSRIKILALLTRLRQICCHPNLFITNYKGESSKLNQCIEILKDAIQSGHKILLFSGYTSMFEIIEEKLKEENISYFKLTGQTKISNRLQLVEEFNKNPNIKVFLISLKAGGTGLNLTGADMVIHYDPWWNIAAENQATDRAYRIGQKNNVQVYKLITKNSIEEKIYELQEKKAKLIDDVLNTKTSFISKLSKEDILKLFE